MDAAYEALQLQELYTELNRADETKGRPADFRARLAAAERDAKKTETTLRARRFNDAGAALGRIAAGCASCHARYRDVPKVTPPPAL